MSPYTCTRMYAYSCIQQQQVCMHDIPICMISYFDMHAYIQSCMYMHIYAYICIGIEQASSHVNTCAYACIHAPMYACILGLSSVFHCVRKGVSADADPHYQKLYGRVTDVCSNRKSQPSQGAMKWPRLGRYPSLIRYAPPSGKYAALRYHRWLDLSSFT